MSPPPAPELCVCLAGSEDHQAQRDGGQVHHLQAGAVTQWVRMRGSPCLGGLWAVPGDVQCEAAASREMSQSFKWLLEGAVGESRVRLPCHLSLCSGRALWDLGCSERPGAGSAQGAGGDSYPFFSSRCEELGDSHQQFTGTQRSLPFRGGQGNPLATLPLCSPVAGPHSLSSSLDFVVTPQSHPGLSHGGLKRWEEMSGKGLCFPIL